MSLVARWMLLVAGGILSLIPIGITVFRLWGAHRRVDTLAHGASGASLALFSLALLPLPPVGHALLVTIIGVGWEVVEPRLEALGYRLHTGPQDTEADIAVVGLLASLTVLVIT